MTVDELIKELKKQPPDAVIVVDFDCESPDAYTVKVDGSVAIREDSGHGDGRRRSKGRKFIALIAGRPVGKWRN